jgi:hypothetical protein
MATTTKTVPATEPQRNYVKKLRDGRELPADVVAFYTDDFIDEKMTKVQASKAIDAMRGFAFKPNTKAEVVAEAKVTNPVTEEGIYERKGHVYDVVQSKAGHWYAKELTDEGFVYVGAAPVKALTANDKMTKARATELSLARARCIRCGKQLSKQSSVDQGMGDICASYFA